MKKIQTFEYLKAFSRSEILELKEMSQMSRFSFEKEERQMLDFLIEQHPDWEEELSRTKLCEKFGWTHAQWKRILIHLRKLVLAYMQLIADGEEQSHWQSVGDFLKSRSQLTYAERAYQQAEKKLEAKNRLGIKYHLEKCRINLSCFEAQEGMKNDISQTNFIPFLESLDAFFVFSKSFGACELSGTKEFQVASFENWNEAAVLDQAKKLAVERNNPFYHFFVKLKALRAYSEKSDTEIKADELLQQFQLLRTSLEDHYHLVEEDIAGRQAFVILTNFAIAQKRKGVPGFALEQYKLMIFGIRSGISLKDGQIEEIRFQNLIVSAAGNYEFEQAEQFIDQYFDKIIFTMPPKGFLHFCRAIICYFKKEFDACIDHLRMVPNSNRQRNMIVKTIEIQCFYEIYFAHERDANLLINKIENFRKSIRADKKVGTPVKNSHLRFLRLLRQIVWAQIRDNLSPTKMVKWQAEVNKQERLANRLWLISVLQRLPHYQS